MKYQPIETAPKDGTDVLIWQRWCYVPIVASWQNYGLSSGGRWYANFEHYDCDSDACVMSTLDQSLITHWAPLPTPPESEA